MLDKHIRKAMKMPTPPRNPFAALMQPMVIVPENSAEKPVIADVGSIIFLADQRTMYRDWSSPITRRADEILVQYGKPDRVKFGWITNKQSSKIMKPSQGPTFLVTTRNEKSLIAWEQLRLMVALTRKNDPTNWIAPWLAVHGQKHSRLLREVTRFFGGTPVKNEDFDTRCMRLYSLILHTELDMSTAKASKSKKKGKKGKHTKAEKETSKTKKHKKSGKKTKASREDASDRPTAKQDDFVIKRLVKENPRRAGSEKAKIWNKLKKGMTVSEFVEKGGSRASVGRYVENGWIKLLRPGS